MDLLQVVQAHGPPEAWVGAGALRTPLWNRAHGWPDTQGIGDIDVVWFAPGPWEPALEQHYTARLQAARPELRWDVCNQAWVHHWYPARFGASIDPLSSVEAGIASWPETATAVAARRSAQGALEILAPHGAEDLLEMVLRPSPGRAAAFEARLAQKRFCERWPHVRRAAG